MNRLTQHLPRAAQLLGNALVLAALASCGGGDGVVGSGGTGISAGLAVGTVNGFGSVIVDGVAYDNRSAPVLSEIAPGQDAVAEVKLGDRVAIEDQTAGVASVVRLEAALSGSVTSAASEGRFTMLGQTVAINTSGAAGPITQLGGGYALASDLRVGDRVEVHGVLVGQADSYRIQATRIDKLAAAPAYLRVTGLVSHLGSDGTFSLGALTVDASGAGILPASTSLANGQTVTVLALPGLLTPPHDGSQRLNAAQVRILELQSRSLEDALSGSVTHLDAAARTLTLGGVRVDYSAATLSPPATTLADGQYVVVRGTPSSTGTLAASSLSIRDAGSDSEAALRGNLRGYVAATGRFFVRDVGVDASGASVQGCPAAGLADGQFVVVQGAVSSAGVVAQKVQCEAEPADAEVERDGLAGAVDIAAAAFTLTTESGSTVSVSWTATTYFGGVTPQTLSGKVVQVEGSLVGGRLVAAKIKVGD